MWWLCLQSLRETCSMSRTSGEFATPLHMGWVDGWIVVSSHHHQRLSQVGVSGNQWRVREEQKLFRIVNDFYRVHSFSWSILTIFIKIYVTTNLYMFYRWSLQIQEKLNCLCWGSKATLYPQRSIDTVRWRAVWYYHHKPTTLAMVFVVDGGVVGNIANSYS